MRLSTRAGVVVLLAACAAVAHPRAADPTAAELARALQKKYDTVRDFSADFVQTYKGGVVKRQLTEKGRMLIRKPGKMRWEYDTPEKKLFVSIIALNPLRTEN
jgi:outer membrane lipoprotein carrier protein